MYRKTIVLFFVGLTALSMPSMQASSIMIDIGAIPYGSYRNIMINQSYDVNLSLLYTPIVNDVAFQKLGFNPLVNSTTYYFQSLGIPIDYTFKNDTKPSLFQDSMGQVYRLFIDYRNVSVPVNPLLEPYNNLTLRLNATLSNLSRLNLSLGNLTVLMNSSLAAMNISLVNWSVNYSSLNDRFIRKSLDAEQDNRSAVWFAQGLKDANALLFKTWCIFPFIIIFTCAATIYLGRRMRWFNPNKSRKIIRTETGFPEVVGKFDKFNVKRVDSITRNERPDTMEAQESVEEPVTPEVQCKPHQVKTTGPIIAKAKTATKTTNTKELIRMYDSVDNM